MQCDIFGDWEKSSAWMRDSEEFHSNPMGTFVDPALVAEAAAEGAGLAEIHERAKAKEFSLQAAPVEIPYAE